MKFTLNPTEADEQERIFRWVELVAPYYPELEWLFAVPNGGSRHMLEAVNLKRQGVKKGVPDMVLPIPRGPWNALWIELKRPSIKPKTKKGKGGVSDDQERWHKALRSNGHAVYVCYGADEAIKVLTAYLESGKRKPSSDFSAGYPRLQPWGGMRCSFQFDKLIFPI